jgi:hypothetical protein
MQTDQIINNFYDSAIVDDFSRDYLFRVESIVIDGLRGPALILSPDDLLYARTAKLPGRTIVNHQVKYAGQTFNVPGSVEYPGSENYEMEFYCPERSTIRERLMNESHRTFGNVNGLAGSGRTGGSITNRFSRITLLQLDKRLDIVSQYELIGCSIRNVGEISYSIADGNGAIMTFNVGIAYHFFHRKNFNGITANNS